MYKNFIKICLVVGLSNPLIFAGEMEDGDKAISTGDSVKAFQLYMSAAEKGNLKAQTKIAYMYIYGDRGVPKDEQKGIEWFKKAADNGESHAQFILAEMYRDGKGGKQDYLKAIDYYQKSSEQGNLQATEYLGTAFETGVGVNKNSKISYALFTVACSIRCSNLSLIGMETATKSLNNEELTEAKALAKDTKKLWKLINIAKKEEFKRMQLKFDQQFNITKSAGMVYGKLLIPKTEYIFVKFEPEGCLKKFKIYDKDNNTISLRQSYDPRFKIENQKQGFRPAGEYYFDFLSLGDNCEIEITEGETF